MRKKSGLGIVATTVMIMGTGVACGGGGSGAADSGGGGNLPNCSSGKNAFETYGSAGLSKVVANVGLNIAAEFAGSNGGSGVTNLGASFTKVGSAANGSDYADNNATFVNKLTAFVIFAYGGPSTYVSGGTTYNGDIDMVAAHKGMAITQAEYDYFINNDVVPALTASGVSGSDATNCIAPVVTSSAFEAMIIGQ